MITLLNDAPENVAAFNASGEINQKDFETIVIPHVKNKLAKFDELNYLLYVNTDTPKTDVDAWLRHSNNNLKNVSKYNRAAVVSDEERFQSDGHPDNDVKFKFFTKDNVYKALFWCNNGNDPENS